MAQYDINLRDYFRILRRRKGIVILVPLIFALSSFALAILQAPRPLYRATAVVRFERAVSVSGLLQELVSAAPVGNVETQAALIKGFPVLGLAAKKLALIPQAASADEIRTTPAYLRAIDQLHGQIAVKLSEGTSLIEISATSPDPVEAARVANSVAEAFQQDNFEARGRQVREAREFIERQLGEVGARLRESEDELKAFKEANRILVFPEETKESLRRLAALEGDYAGVRAAIGETEAQLRLLQTGKVLGRPTGPSPDGADPTVTKIYGSLSDLTLQRDALLLSLLPGHPQVQQLDAQITNLRTSLGDALTSRLQALRARADELQRSIARLRQEQATIPAAEIRMARMEREVKVAERMFSLLKEKHQEALIREKEQVAEISLVRPAVVSPKPINSPQALPKAAIGLVIGLVMGFILAFVVETLDTSVGAIDDVESFLESPVLGVIPHLDVRSELSEEGGPPVTLDRNAEEKYSFLISLFLPNSRVVEAIRGLRTNLLFSGLDQNLKTIMVTSATPGEGKTTVAINLAIVLAQLGKRTLLIEADLRNPFLHHAFGIPREPGFTDVVVGSARLDEATLTFSDFVLGRAGLESLIDRPGLDNLFLLPSGHQPPNPTEFLSAPALAAVLADLRQRYDYVVVDCAPILPVADPAILGARVDGTLLVVRVGSVARAALRRAKALLEAARARLLGVCLTGVKAEVSPDYAEMGYYRYRYEARDRRPARSPWLGTLAGDRKSNLRGLVLLLVLLLLVAGGLWAWQAGRFRLPFVGRLGDIVRQVEPVRPAPGPARVAREVIPGPSAGPSRGSGPSEAARATPIFTPEQPASERDLATGWTPTPTTVTARAEPPAWQPEAATPRATPTPPLLASRLPEQRAGEREVAVAPAARRPAPPTPPVTPAPAAPAPAGPSSADSRPEPAGPPRYAVQLHAFPSADEARRVIEDYRAAGPGDENLAVTALSATKLRVLGHAFTSTPVADPGEAAGGLPPLSINGPRAPWRVLAGTFETPEQAEALGWRLLRQGRIAEFLIVETPPAP